jgi:chromosome segregation ATPase
MYGPIVDSVKEPLDRILELERVWPIIQEKLKSYDGIFEEIQSLKKQLSSVEGIRDSFKRENESLHDYIDDITRLFQSKFDILAGHLDSIKKTADTNSNDLKDFKKDVQTNIWNTNNSVVAVQNTVEDKFSKSASKANLDSHKSYIDSKIEQLISEMDSMHKKHADLAVVLSSLRNGIATMKEDFEEKNKRTTDIESQNSNLLTAFENFKTFTSTSIYSQVQKVEQKVISLENGIKTSISSVESSIPSVKDEIYKKLEGVALDGSNAVLRSNNSANQIALLEKKIENLSLRMKALETPKS